MAAEAQPTGSFADALSAVGRCAAAIRCSARSGGAVHGTQPLCSAAQTAGAGGTLFALATGACHAGRSMFPSET